MTGEMPLFLPLLMPWSICGCGQLLSDHHQWPCPLSFVWRGWIVICYCVEFVLNGHGCGGAAANGGFMGYACANGGDTGPTFATGGSRL